MMSPALDGLFGRLDAPTRADLTAYYCPEANPRTGRACRTMLFEAWAPAGALIRRRCKQCGAWSLVVVKSVETESP